MNPTPPQFVSRGGLKLHHALAEFAIDATGLVCADLGCSTGGFTDCLLQSGAAKVHSVDTAYGELAWKLRNDPRVVVTERTNALHAVPPSDGVDLVVVDLGWTVQRLVIPAALKWLRPSGRIITLIKPHYEAKEFGIDLPRKGVLDESIALDITNRVMARIDESAQHWGVTIRGLTKSPILGGKEKATGNPEWLALIQKKQSI
ncbi:MAG: TlyA family rRNA (cytidine-2'-O)-methyltransferase [Planctomycetes bacterium]|nr:TlyA family rRNA (cytidine-2'-O)-methyltransferase [Planctomycetota bacterium]